MLFADVSLYSTVESGLSDTGISNNPGLPTWFSRPVKFPILYMYLSPVYPTSPYPIIHDIRHDFSVPLCVFLHIYTALSDIVIWFDGKLSGNSEIADSNNKMIHR